MLRIFTYKCDKCNETFDEFRETSTDDIQICECPKCGEIAVKQFTTTAMVGEKVKGKCNSQGH